MQIFKKFPIFFFNIFIVVISLRFLFFISYINGQKTEFRKQLISEKSQKIVQLKFSKDDVYLNKNGFEWKEENKELLVNGIFHEVIAINEVNGFFVVSLIEDEVENSLFRKFFCVNKGIHKDFSELIKLLLNLTYLKSNSNIVFNDLVLKNHPTISDVHFSDFKFYLKQIKPPRV